MGTGSAVLLPPSGGSGRRIALPSTTPGYVKGLRNWLCTALTSTTLNCWLGATGRFLASSSAAVSGRCFDDPGCAPDSSRRVSTWQKERRKYRSVTATRDTPAPNSGECASVGWEQILCSYRWRQQPARLYASPTPISLFWSQLGTSGALVRSCCGLWRSGAARADCARVKPSSRTRGWRRNDREASRRWLERGIWIRFRRARRRGRRRRESARRRRARDEG